MRRKEKEPAGSLPSEDQLAPEEVGKARAPASLASRTRVRVDGEISLRDLGRSCRASSEK